MQVTTLDEFHKLTSILEKYFLSIVDRRENCLHFSGATVYFKFREDSKSMSIIEGGNVSYSPNNMPVFLARAVIEILKAQEDILAFPDNFTWDDKLQFVLRSMEKDISNTLSPGFVFKKKGVPFEDMENITLKI